MRIFNIVTKTTYEREGQQKNRWNQVGRLIHFPASSRGDEGYKVELFMHPDTQFYVFPQRDREDRPRFDSRQATPPEEEIKAEDIPL